MNNNYFTFSGNEKINGKLVETYLFLSTTKKKSLSKKMFFRYLIFLDFFSLVKHKVFWFRKKLNSNITIEKIKEFKELVRYFFDNLDNIMNEYNLSHNSNIQKTYFEEYLSKLRHFSKSDKDTLLYVVFNYSSEDINTFYSDFKHKEDITGLTEKQLSILNISLSEYKETLDYSSFLYGKIF